MLKQIKNKLSSFYCVILITFFAIACNSNTIESNSNFRIDTILDSIQKTGKINGFSVAVIQDDQIYSEGFGYSNLETKKKYTDTTLQHIASVSKTFIGIALLKAQELGYLNLDDPIQKYIPFTIQNPHFPDAVISIRHLATHTSSINDANTYLQNAWVIYKDQDLSNINTHYPHQRLNPSNRDITMEDFLKEILTAQGIYYSNECFINFTPGARYNYSNIGAALAALVIEKATKTSFSTFTKKYIFTPLKMSQTSWFLDDIDKSKHATLYRSNNTPLPLYQVITYPDGNLISCSKDIAIYLSELINGYSGQGSILSQESYRELFRPQLLAKHFEDRNEEHPYNGDYNTGIFMGMSAKGFIGHAGGDAGVATWMFFNSQTKTGRYLVVNTDLDEREAELEFYAIWDELIQD